MGKSAPALPLSSIDLRSIHTRLILAANNLTALRHRRLLTGRIQTGAPALAQHIEQRRRVVEI